MLGIADRVKVVRAELNLSQDKFAETLNVARNTIARIEMGDRSPSNRTMADICYTHNVNEQWLRTGEGEMFKPKKKRPDDLMGLIGELDDHIVDGTGKHSEFKEWLVIKTLKMSDDQLDVLKELLLDFSSNEIEGLDKKKYED